MNNYFALENEVLHNVKTILEKFEIELKHKGIIYDLKLKLNENNSEKHNSEIEIVFFKNNDIMDIIEFFIIRKNEIYVNLDNYREELNNDLIQLLSQIS